ncbi:MAG: class I SAM-dependent methyltransferase [Candidatus Magasanikbacteria bacterium]|nr:class I SAM-dependent methyltransferase [Candidatus Magasanikbacteria bacterium]
MDIVQKTRDDYNKIAKHFATTRSRAWPEFDQFSALIKNGQRILDWGCGAGRLLMMLKNRPVEYFGIDQSIELLKIARRQYSKLIKAGRAHFYSTAAREKKFPPGYFDLVFMIASFFHLPDETSRQKLLAKTFRELKPGGKLVMLVWNLGSDWAKEKKKEWKQIGEQDFLIPWKNQQGEVMAERYYHHFTPEELTGLLTQTGFVVERMDYFAGKWSDSKGGRNLVAVALKK